jgi:leader peptidase (prepilin peptidase) / N-methyltransferase
METTIPIVLGLFAGWLINYLADVLPLTRRLSQPVCKQCQTVYPPVDYLLLRPCRSCGQRRGWRSWLTQLLALAGTLYIWTIPPKTMGFAAGLLLLTYLGVILIIDLEHRLILHPTSLFGALLGLGIGTLAHGLEKTLIGGAFGFAVMLGLYYLGDLFRRSLSRRRGVEIEEEALGFGDVNLAGILGLLLGWPLIWVSLLFGILAGGVISLFIIVGMLISRRYQAFTAIPYAPFLILGAVFFLYR